MIRNDDRVAKAIRERLDPIQSAINEKMVKVEAYYRETDSDELIMREIDVVARAASRASKDGHILLVLGESHSGKSTLINHWLDECAALQPKEIEDNNFIYPIFRCRSPQGDVGALGNEMAFRLGYRSQRPLRRDAAFRRVRAQLQIKGIKLVFIDDFHNLIPFGATAKNIVPIAQELKALLQDDDWPVHIILAGLPRTEDLSLEDPTLEIEGRLRVRRMKELTYLQHHRKVRKMIKEVISIAELEVGMPLHDEFLARLIHGARNRIGLIFKMLHYAIEDALDSGEKEIVSSHWIDAYMELAKRGRNVFVEEDWQSIVRGVNSDGTLTEEDKSQSYSAIEKSTKG